MNYPVQKSDDEWKQSLSPERFHVLRQAGTEPAWTGELLNEKRSGQFHCAGCGQALFSSDTKFESGSGWPSFWDAVRPDAVELKEDHSHGMVRTEVLCAQCGGHLGHLFPDAFDTPTCQRYFINSLSLEFTPGS
jgi:peptide-methionine (R)-S-oxide reductase